MVVSSVDLTWWELTGLLGACLYAVGYLCAAFDRLTSQTIQYYLIKMIAAVMVLISLTQSFNLASAVIQTFFIFVSLIGIARHMGRARGRPAGEPPMVIDLSQCETADKNWRRRSDFG